MVVDTRISADELARRLGDVLERIRCRGDSFVVEKNGDPVARLVPLPPKARATVGDALTAWCAAGKPDRAFAADLERLGATHTTLGNPWAS